MEGQAQTTPSVLAARVVSRPGRRASSPKNVFRDGEISQLVGLFSRMLKAGFWHDYSIDHSDTLAVFCVYRYAREAPEYQLVRGNQDSRLPEWQVFQRGRFLKHSASLPLLLTWLEARARRMRRG